ncbi:hypothetical protein NpPPO83_00007671 [Neofusicoccum parvum]|uniref:Uncharacterized protein n=1 Tax=Neofusicoccum parvum TaxID=310453 RepID=A0ACB5S9Y4_9PEZI|nr:hypothetical protein NpPPO83_00007671 [Neofusicoccum parvum]
MPRVSRQGVRRNRISRIIDFAYGDLTCELDESEHFEVKAFRSNHGGTWTAYLTGACESGEAHVIMELVALLVFKATPRTRRLTTIWMEYWIA